MHIISSTALPMSVAAFGLAHAQVKLPGDEEFRDSKEALRKKRKAEGEMRRRNAKKKEE